MGARSHQGAHRRCRWQGVPQWRPSGPRGRRERSARQRGGFLDKGEDLRSGAGQPSAAAPKTPAEHGRARRCAARQCGVMDERVRFINQVVAPLRVAPGRAVELSRDFDSAYADGVKRSEADDLLTQGVELLTEYQDRLFAQASSAVLLVLQGPDASGKDSTVKQVMRGINPQGVDVRSFSQPSAEELRHDFLWRCQRVLPERGRIGVFNRSYYEEVLVVRVHPELLVPQNLPELPSDESIWARRYREINEFERYLV